MLRGVRLLPLALPSAGLLLWFFLSHLALVPEYLLPSPEHAAATLATYVAGSSATDPYAGRFWLDLWASLSRVGAGFGLAVVLGLPLGLVSGRSRPLALAFSPLVHGVRAVPGICWLPLALVWLGIGLKTTIFLITLAAFFPIYLNAAAGAAAVPEVQLRAGAMLGLSPLGMIRQVLLPSAMGQIRSGLRIGLGLSFAYLVLGELTGVSLGLGAMIMDARLLGRVDLIIAGIVIIALTGWGCDSLLKAFLRIAFKSARRMNA